jgi:hypothetical protein
MQKTARRFVMKWLIFSATVAKAMKPDEIDEYCRKKFPISQGWKMIKARCEVSMYSKEYIICATYQKEYQD